MKRRKVVEGEDEVDFPEMEPVLAGKKSEPTHTALHLVKESIQAPICTNSVLCSHHFYSGSMYYVHAIIAEVSRHTALLLSTLDRTYGPKPFCINWQF